MEEKIREASLPVSHIRACWLLFSIAFTCFASLVVFFSPDYADSYHARKGQLLTVVALPLFVVGFSFSLYDRLTGRGVRVFEHGVNKNTLFRPFFLEWSEIERIRVFNVIGFAEVRIICKVGRPNSERVVQLLELNYERIDSIKDVAPVPVEIIR